MRAIDTNVVVRFLTKDDKRQALSARKAIEAGDVFISTTVLLESEWVLRSAYGYTPVQIIHALRSIAGLPGVSVDEPTILAHALEWHEQGMDFADALHLMKTDGCRSFLTFDRKLVAAAKALSAIKVEEP